MAGARGRTCKTRRVAGLEVHVVIPDGSFRAIQGPAGAPNFTKRAHEILIPAGIPAALPALARAQAVQAKAAQSAQVELSPEAAAVRQAHDPETRSRAIGAMLWQAVTEAASWDVDAETALRETIARFVAGSEGAPA